MGLSRLAKVCQECMFVETCENKRMEALAYLPDPITAPTIPPLASGTIQPMARETVSRFMYGKEYSMYKDDLEQMLYGELYKGLGLKYGG